MILNKIAKSTKTTQDEKACINGYNIYSMKSYIEGHRNYILDLQGSAVTTGAPAILLNNFCPQTIFKLQPSSSLDHSARNGPQSNRFCILSKYGQYTVMLRQYGQFAFL